jgi:ferredoxin
MPAKYLIHTRTVPHRFEPLTRSGVIAWEEGCLKCAVCVKKKCVYGVYDRRGVNPKQMIESIDNQCMNCLRCVQSCPKELIHKSFNPEFNSIGDDHWTPDIIARLWYQAETGKIPVSGAGYPGPFSGPGFDSMWTDMSEIVRPTRDGIHGREYISTAVDLGSHPRSLVFDPEGGLGGESPQVLALPLPIILRMPAFGAVSDETLMGWAVAARQLGTLFALPVGSIRSSWGEFGPSLIPTITPDQDDLERIPRRFRVIELAFSEGRREDIERLQARFPSSLMSLRIPIAEGVEDRALKLAEAGISILHLEGSTDGRYMDDPASYLKDGLRRVHVKLVENGLRDQMTLLASGGLAMAEQVAKSIICGADAVMVDVPLLIALECRICRRCTQQLPCPVDLGQASHRWVAARVVNLLGAWHNQLLEVMGAMGIRDARRLRGEVGRAMFFETLDKETFGSLGKMEEGCELE